MKCIVNCCEEQGQCYALLEGMPLIYCKEHSFLYELIVKLKLNAPLSLKKYGLLLERSRRRQQKAKIEGLKRCEI